MPGRPSGTPPGYCGIRIEQSRVAGVSGMQHLRERQLRAYDDAVGASILSGFGTVLAFRLMDTASRNLVQERYGANRKQIITFAPVRADGVKQDIVAGHVIEDWDLSRLKRGQCIACLPEGPPVLFEFGKYSR